MMRVDSTPLVTIAMPVFNAAKTIEAAVLSIIQQSYENWELIIVDDGSCDRSEELINRYTDSRIVVFRDSSNRGISHRLNQAIDAAKGRYFARMDADDISFPERIARQVNYMEDHPDTDLVAAGILVFGNDGSAKGRVPVKTNHDEICSRPWNGFYMSHPTWLGRIEWFKNHRYRSSADKAEDQDLLFRAYLSSHFACLPDVLLAYRQDIRSLAKMLIARRILARSFIETALQRGQYGVIFHLIYNIPLKMIADILNIKCNVKRLRYKLDTVPQDVLLRWQKVWSDTQVANSYGITE